MHLGQLLANEREQKQISQREVGALLGISQVSISRMESDADLDPAEATKYLEAIKSEYATKIRDYSKSSWNHLALAPPLDHPDLSALMSANDGLQRIADLVQRVPETHFIRDELDLYQASLSSAADYLLSLDHTVGFIGSIGVGKTTAICAATNLLLEGKPVLDYGGGRTTICEVVINTGPGWGLIVEPLEDDEIAVIVDDFCDYILSRAAKDQTSAAGSADDVDSDVNILSTELTRCIRNMAKLVQKRDRVARRVTDEAVELVRQASSNKERLKLEILERMNLRARSQRELWHKSPADKDPLHWLKRAFTAINHGRNPSFSIPKRINVLVPEQILAQMSVGAEAPLNVSVIDTKGIDQLAPRADISALFDDPRTLCIVCSRFLDAPDETSRSVLKRAVESGLRDRLQTEAQLLVLDRLEEADSVNDFDGTQVDNRDDGRQVRLADVEDALIQEPLRLEKLNATFFNQREDEASELTQNVAAGLRRMRDTHVARIERVLAQIGALERDLKAYQESACYQNIGHTVEVWINDHESLAFKLEQISASLLESIADKSTYAASVRASVNRRGSWYNLNYYYQLAYGARVDFVAATEPAIKKLATLLDNLRKRDDMAPAHAFVGELLDYVMQFSGQLQEQAQLMSQAVFEEPLRESVSLWVKSQEQWGQGTGNYKGDVSACAENWLKDRKQSPLFDALEQSMEKKWGEFLDDLKGKISRALG